MPYNPSSAYPRHSTYTPPVYGRGFARGFNEFSWGDRFGHAVSAPASNTGHAIQAAFGPRNESAGHVLETMNRVGLGTMALRRVDTKAQAWANKQRQRGLGGGGDAQANPHEVAEVAGGAPSSAWPRVARDDIDELNWMLQGTPATTRKAGTPGVAQVMGADDPFGAPAPDPRDTGGRPHVGPPNDRIGAIIERVTTSSVTNDIVNRVISGKGVGGPMTAAKYVFGTARAAARRRK